MFEAGARWILRHDRKVQACNPNGGIELYASGSVPQETKLPFVSFEGVGQSGDTSHQDGTGGLVGDSVLFTAWAADYTAAHKLRNAVRDALAGADPGRYDGDQIEGMFLDQRRSETDPTPARSEHRLHGAAMILAIWHRE